MLKLADENGWTVAHELAKRGNWATEDPEILKLADSSGNTVAHWQAYYGWTISDPQILSLTNTNGKSVLDWIKKRHPNFDVSYGPCLDR
jgi:hypothetical protein